MLILKTILVILELIAIIAVSGVGGVAMIWAIMMKAEKDAPIAQSFSLWSRVTAWACLLVASVLGAAVAFEVIAWAA